MDWKNTLRTSATWIARGLQAVAKSAVSGLRGARRLARRARASQAWSAALRWRRPAFLVGRTAALGFALGLLLLGVLGASIHVVRPGEIGVRQRNWGSGSGLEPVDHGPGLSFSPAWRDTWHTIDGRTHVLSFAFETEGGQREPLEVRTLEGNSAHIAVHVPFSVRPGEAHLLVAQGAKHAYVERARTTTQKVLSQELAKLSSADLASTDLRLARADATLARLNQELAEHHVRAEAVLISGVFFPSTYEKMMQEQQLAGQARHTDEVLSLLEARRIENQLVEQQAADEQRATLVALTAEFDEAQRAALHQRAVAAQENEALAAEIEHQEASLRAELQAALERERTTREAALAVRKASNQSLELELAAASQELLAELDAERLEEERMANSRREALELASRSAARESDSALAALQSEALDTFEQEHLLALAEEHALRAVAARQAADLAATAQDQVDALAREGVEALANAELHREELRAGVLATPGGRLWLAREAAASLHFRRVSLDANDERVPSPFDLDALQRLLLGANAGTVAQEK